METIIYDANRYFKILLQFFNQYYVLIILFFGTLYFLNSLTPEGCFDQSNEKWSPKINERVYFMYKSEIYEGRLESIWTTAYYKTETSYRIDKESCKPKLPSTAKGSELEFNINQIFKEKETLLNELK